MKMGEAVDLLDAFVRYAYNASWEEFKLLFPTADDGYLKEKYKRMEKNLGKFFGDLDNDNRRKFVRLVVDRYFEKEKKQIQIEEAGAKKKIKVFIGLVQYCGGENLYVGTTKDELFGELHTFVVENWAEYMDDQPMPKSIKASISQFFDVAKESGRKGAFLMISEDSIEVEV